MNEHPLPMFDETPTADAPKKQRRKPVKRRKVRKAAVKVEAPPIPEPKKRRASTVERARQMRKARVTNGHAGGRYTKEQYRVIGALMGMSIKERIAVFDIVKGLSK
jgi:hypothetical protein